MVLFGAKTEPAATTALAHNLEPSLIVALIIFKLPHSNKCLIFNQTTPNPDWQDRIKQSSLRF